jgi:hypothetical protein
MVNASWAPTRGKTTQRGHRSAAQLVPSQPSAERNFGQCSPPSATIALTNTATSRKSPAALTIYRASACRGWNYRLRHHQSRDVGRGNDRQVRYPTLRASRRASSSPPPLRREKEEGMYVAGEQPSPPPPIKRGGEERTREQSSQSLRDRSRSASTVPDSSRMSQSLTIATITNRGRGEE